MGTTRPDYRSGLGAVGRSGLRASQMDYLAGRSARHVIWFLAAVAAAGSLALTGSFRGLDGYDFQTVLEFAVGCAFVVSGLVAWSRRENRLGPLMTLIGFTWLARPLVDVHSSSVFTGAIWLQDTWFVLFALFLLSLPYGRLTSRVDFLTMGVLLVVALPLELAWLFFFESGAPGNALLISRNADVADAIDWGQRALVLVGSLALAAILFRRWFEASAPLRRILIPTLVGGAAVLLSTAMTVLAKFTVPPEEVRWLELCAFIAVPVAVLARMLRARLARSSVGDVFVALQTNPPPEDLRDVPCPRSRRRLPRACVLAARVLDLRGSRRSSTRTADRDQRACRDAGRARGEPRCRPHSRRLSPAGARSRRGGQCSRRNRLGNGASKQSSERGCRNCMARGLA